jgi:hypothetical protein
MTTVFTSRIQAATGLPFHARRLNVLTIAAGQCIYRRRAALFNSTERSAHLAVPHKTANIQDSSISQTIFFIAEPGYRGNDSDVERF